MKSRTFFSSDLHFGHANIIKYCNRPWSSVERMDEGLISNWNSVVRAEDKVWMLGDIFFCDQHRAVEIMHRLNGEKHLLLGNHDKLIRNQVPIQKLFAEIYPELHQENIDGVAVVMCHYPLLTWNRARRGSFMLHGHSHNKIAFDPKFRRMDVGVDAQGYTPIEWRVLRKKLEACEAGDVRDY